MVLFLSSIISVTTLAQTRYVDEVFSEDEIVVMKDVFYNRNKTTFHPDSFPELLTSPIFHIDTDLHLDIYMPDRSIDTVEERPVVIIPHGGFFPPYFYNCWGSKEDLATSDLAYRLAKMGYVAIAPELRYGFDVFVNSDFEFIQSIMRFSIGRSIDLKNCARFLRHDYAELGNNYQIHPDKFVLWGTNNQFTMPYTTFYTNESEFYTPFYNLFNFESSALEQVYDSTYFGGFEGLNNGFLDTTQTNIESEYPDYSGHFQLAVYHGTESYDSLFIQENEVPSIFFVSKHSLLYELESFFAIGPQDEYVVEVFFSNWVARKMDELGNVDQWKGVQFSNPIANERLVYPPDSTLGKIEGLYAIEGRPFVLRPWIYWDQDTCLMKAEEVAQSDLSFNTGMTIENGRSILDTMIQFFAPRACLTLDLGCEDILTSTTEPTTIPISLSVAPNPTKGSIRLLSAADDPIRKVEIYDLNGQLMSTQKGYFSNQKELNLNAKAGFYLIKVITTKGIGVQKIILH